MTAPRSLAERTRDTRALFDSTVDCWVVTAHRGRPLLAPLSFLVADGRIWMATPVDGALGTALSATPRVRLGLGHTRDVVLVHGDVDRRPLEAADPEFRDDFRTRCGFDPSGLPGYAWFVVTPDRIDAWREENELAGRTIMRNGAWLADAAST